MLITDGILVTLDANNRILTDHALHVTDGVIDAIGPAQQVIERYPHDERISANGAYVMPGNICAHTHFYGAYARGMAIPGDPPRDFPEILSRLWWNLDKALDRDAVRASALVCLVDAVKHGTTTLFDHHASPNFIDGSLDVIAAAVEQAGLSAVLCYEVTDRDGQEKADAGIAENVRFIRAWQDHPRIRGTFGLHASLTISEATMRASKNAHPLGDAGGFHIHVAEHEADEEDSLKKYGKRVIQRLHEHGILGENTITAHCVHTDDAERALILDTGTWVTHQPRSNMNNAVGAMPLDAMMSAGMKLCLGNDGFSNVMYEDWKAAYFLHKVVSRDPRRANGSWIADMALRNNAALAEQFFPGQQIGKLIPGARADIIFVDYHPFTPLTAGNLPWHIIFGIEASMIMTTIAGGHVLMRDRQLLTLDERAIAEEALALAPAVWERYNRIAQAT